MSIEVRISPEIARLAQSRARSLGVPSAAELARLVVEEAIVGMDPEAGFILDGSETASRIDVLAQIAGANDIVVNGRRFDVRPLNADGQASVPRCLVGTSYLAGGSLAVVLDGADHGEIVGYISPSQWVSAENEAGDDEDVLVAIEVTSPFNFDEALRSPGEPVAPSRAQQPDSAELSKFVACRREIPVARQRQIVEVLLESDSAQKRLAQVASLWSDGTLGRILSTAALWNSRLESVVDKISPKFQHMSRAEIKKVVASAGESAGGQPESPQFKKTMLALLARAEMARRLKGADLARLSQLVEGVLAGRSATEAASDFVKNKVALNLASAIKKGRGKLELFAAATADEIGMAFHNLALQPAYATHSQDPQAGVEAINEALYALEAAEIADEIKKLEQSL